MDTPPADLLATLPAESEATVRRWWSSLSDADRVQVAGLWDQRLEVRFFTPQPDAAGRVDQWKRVPAVTGGHFVPHDDARRVADWLPSHMEYLLGHPEFVLLHDRIERVYHIGCRQHAAARRCLADGRIPTDFRCPLAHEACPLERLQGVQFTPLPVLVHDDGDSCRVGTAHPAFCRPNSPANGTWWDVPTRQKSLRWSTPPRVAE